MKLFIDKIKHKVEENQDEPIEIQGILKNSKYRESTKKIELLFTEGDEPNV